MNPKIWAVEVIEPKGSVQIAIIKEQCQEENCQDRNCSATPENVLRSRVPTGLTTFRRKIEGSSSLA